LVDFFLFFFEDVNLLCCLCLGQVALHDLIGQPSLVVRVVRVVEVSVWVFAYDSKPFYLLFVLKVDFEERSFRVDDNVLAD
jgi:hypothetical protein